MSECEENEYRCNNGQCISKSFYRNNDFFVDCLDGSDEHATYRNAHDIVSEVTEPIFVFEDVMCSIFRSNGHLFLSSSCVRQRSILLTKALFSVKPSNLSDLCW